MYRPKSVLRLILAGFAVVAVPLIVALVNASHTFDTMADQSQRAVLKAVQATRASGMLVEHLTAMERSARQYQVVRNPTLFDVYAEAHEKFQRARNRLSELPLDARQREALLELGLLEARLYRRLESVAPDSPELEDAVAEFPALSELAGQIYDASSELVDREVTNMEGTADRANRMLAWQVVALAPIAMILAGVFTVLIAKPIRQIGQAIRQLGDGGFTAPIEISGPRDLANLGERLTWLRARLLALEEEKQKFLHHVSHELKTPLTAIREGSELLSDQVVGPLNPEQREVSRIMRDNGVQLQRLIEDMLSFNLAKSRPALPEAKDHDMVVVVRTVLENHKLAMRAKNLHLVTDLGKAPVRGDAEKLSVVVDNLLSNAVKYCPPEGAIKVMLRRVSEHVVLDVLDSGSGFGSLDEERVFEAFYQGDAPFKGHVKGSGLGLSIAREYVQSHNGRIEVISPESRGAHVRVILPASSAGTRHGCY